MLGLIQWVRPCQIENMEKAMSKLCNAFANIETNHESCFSPSASILNLVLTLTSRIILDTLPS